jgi:hypothetical protein
MVVPPLFKSYQFYVLLAGLIVFIVKQYAPEFPLSEAEIVALFVFALGVLGIQVEGRSRGLW